MRAPAWALALALVGCHGGHTFGASTAGLPASWTVPAWYVDPLNSTGTASDANSCQSAGAQCLTWGAVNVARWGCLGSAPKCPRLRQNTTLNFTSQPLASDPFYLNYQPENGASVTIIGAAPVNTTPLGGDVNSYAVGNLADEQWEQTFPLSSGYMVRSVDQGDNAPWADSQQANPYANAAAFSYRAFRSAAPPGATAATACATWKLPTGIASAVPSLILASSTTPTIIASLTPALTSNYVTNCVTGAVSAGTEYLALVAMNNADAGAGADAGTSVQAQAEVSRVTLTYAGAAGPVLNGPFVRVPALPQTMADNGQGFDLTERGYRHSSGSRFVIRTGAPQLVIEQWCNNTGSSVGTTPLNTVIKVNGRIFTSLAPPNNAGTLYYQTIDVSSLPLGPNTIEIIEPATYQPGSAMLGTFLRAVYVPTQFEPATVVSTTPAAPFRRMVAYGDSTSNGYFTSITQSWPLRVRDGYPGSVQIEAYAGRQLAYDCSSAATCLAFAKHLAASNPNDVWINIGTNDWGNAAQSPATFGTNYGLLLTDLHAILPGAQIYAQDPLIRNLEWVAVSGALLSDYRAQIGAACAPDSPWCRHVYGAGIIALTDLGVDGIHPSISGYDKIARYVLGLLGFGPAQPFAITPTSTSLTSLSVWGIYTSANASASTWTDTSGNGRNATQATGGKQPSIVAAQQNGLPAVRFGGASTFMATGAVTLASPFTAFAVVRPVALHATGANDVLLDGFTADTVAMATDTTPQTYMNNGGSGVTKTASLSTTAYSIAAGIFSGSGSSLYIYPGGGTFGYPVTALSISTGTVGTTAAGGLTIANLSGSSTRGLDADFGEVDVFTGTASAQDECVFVESYLKPTWAL